MTDTKGSRINYCNYCCLCLRPEWQVAIMFLIPAPWAVCRSLAD